LLTQTPPPSSSTGFLCPLGANTYGIEYLEFSILDYKTKNVIFNIGKDNPPPMDMSIDLANLDENSFRSIKYEFSEDVLRLPSIQVSHNLHANCTILPLHLH
jgi:hypothetical protein